MKTYRLLLVGGLMAWLGVSAWAAAVTTAMTPGAGGKVVVEATGVAPVAPLFF